MRIAGGTAALVALVWSFVSAPCKGEDSADQELQEYQSDVMTYLEGAEPDAWKTFQVPVHDDLKFWIIPFAYLRMEYEHVEDDDRFEFVGDNDGFILENARTGAAFGLGPSLSAAISVEAASDVHEDSNTPLGEIDVRLRDGYLRYDPFEFIGIQGGQFKVPFTAEDLRSRTTLLFVSRAVGQEGVLVGRGFEQDGIGLDRDVGVQLSPRKPIGYRDFGFNYYLMIANGNGENELLNDNDKVAVIGRVEAMFRDFVTLGGAFLTNERRVGTPPNQFNEDDVGFATDLMINPYGLELFFQYEQINTDFKTVDVDDRTQRAWHVQIGYRFKTPWVWVTPAYRFAQFDPFADGGNGSGGLDLDSFELDYHTLGLRLEHPKLPLSLFINYTFTEEESPRDLDNDRFQILTQVVF